MIVQAVAIHFLKAFESSLLMMIFTPVFSE